MYKKLLIGFALLAILTTVLAACSIRDTSGPAGPVVHMGNADFLQSTITIKKGESVLLVDDVASTHIITNGEWKDSKPVTASESGAPSYNKTFGGNDSDSLGPFNTTGTFHYYCTVHENMNLTITVQ